LDLTQKNFIFVKFYQKAPMHPYAEIISETLMFEGLPAEHVEALLHIAVEKAFEKQEMIFFEGDRADGLYVNIEGMIKIYKLSSDGKEQILHIFGPGEPFGEVPVFSGKTFPAHAEAIVKSRVLFFPRDALVSLLTQNPGIAMNMLAVMSMRLRQFTVQIENLTLKEVPGRLAAYLLMLASEQGNDNRVHLTFSKAHLAGFLGTIPETLSRMLGRMADHGLIHVAGRKIDLLDMEGLKSLAASGRISDF
jgi:CRP/FNR family transcriptional regulator, dissimilatory nitrate respiration regulator